MPQRKPRLIRVPENLPNNRIWYKVAQMPNDISLSGYWVLDTSSLSRATLYQKKVIMSDFEITRRNYSDKGLAIFTIQKNGANMSLGISVSIASVRWDVEATQNWFLPNVKPSFLMSMIPLNSGTSSQLC